MGTLSTPAGQSDFGINSNVPLSGLIISGNNGPTAVTKVNTLTLNGELLINNGATYNANGIGLVLNNNFVNNGTFTPSGNTTIFSSDVGQIISGTGSTTFFQFTKQNDGVLNIQNNGITITDLFSHEAGVINDNGNTIDLKSNAVIEGDMTSSGGEGLKFSGVTQQQLQRLSPGTSTLGVVTIANTAGVVIPEANGFDFLIEGDLRMNGGLFNIGSSEVIIGQSADITTNGTFSVTNMVRTNSSFTDNGLTKIFPAGYNTNFIFPIGELFYTPVSFDFSVSGGTSGSSVGSISARPANEYHPTVDDGNDFYASDIDNVLQYYWTVRSTGINGLVADVDFKYDQSHVLAANASVTEATYIAARILAFGNPTNDINKFTVAEVDEAANLIRFPASLAFNGVGSNGISGDYFAGDDDAIPNNVATYTTQVALGDVTNTTTYIEGLPTDGVAPSGAILVVSAGTEVTFNVDNVQLYRTIIENGATLNIDDTDGHRLGILEGTGNLKITSNTNNAPLPPADYGTFFSCAGGGLEYAGTGNYSILGSVNTLRSLTLSGSGSRDFPNLNVRICEDLTISGPEVNSPFNENIRIDNNLVINSGSFNTNSSRLFVFGTTRVLGGILDGVGRNKDFNGPVVIDGGNFKNGSTGVTIFKDDLDLLSGSFTKGTGSHRVLFTNNIVQTVTGDFTGSNAFSSLQINKIASNVNFTEGAEVSTELRFTSGKISSVDGIIFGSSALANPANGTIDSYIIGKVFKPLNAGQNFTFPIGSIDRWRPTTIYGVNAGYIWEAQFFAADVLNNTIIPVDDMSTSDINIATIQQGEYYVISDGGTGGTASSVQLSWGLETDVANNSSDRGQLRVMVYNTGTSQWDNLGQQAVNGATQSFGTVRSANSQSFSEKIFVLGSTDAANPLPVELVYFRANNSRTSVDLEWQTASEFNNDFFEVQRSFDGKEFEVIGIVEGNGTTNQTMNYDFVDYSPLAGDSYYRLRQVDYNGDYEYSPVAKVTREEETNMMLVPNPTITQNINLRLSGFHGEQKIHVKIYDVTGKLFYSGVHEPLDIQQKALPVRTEMHPGIYMVEVVQGNTKKQVRLAIR